MSPEEIIAARQTMHGEYANVAAAAQAIKTAIECNTRVVLSAIQKESLDLIATKIARICCGDPSYRDHWDDIAGYAVLVSQRTAQAPAKGST